MAWVWKQIGCVEERNIEVEKTQRRNASARKNKMVAMARSGLPKAEPEEDSKVGGDT